MSRPGSTRRQALAALASFSARSPLLRAQELAGEPPGRITPLGEFANTFEFELVAKRRLDAPTFSTIAGGDRADIERVTFRPRVNIETTKLDLTCELFGQSMFAPILVGPASHQQKFHPDGELAMVRGASAAKAAVVLSSLSSFPVEKIAAEAQTPLWFQVFSGPDVNATRARIQQAAMLGCKVLCITAGTPNDSATAPDWKAVEQLRKGLSIPVVVKGIMTPEAAVTAVKRGIQGIVVSNYGHFAQGMASPFAVLPAVVEAVGGRVPVLIDGGFRRGTDILKALILGAQAVLVSRPALWGLAAHGAGGVQAVMEMLQSEVARNMTMIGAVNLKAFNSSMIKIHSR